MNCDGKTFLKAVGSLLTHLWNDDYALTNEELKKINEAISILSEIRGDKND